ncbi:SDR family NAD(P)-dependent oxidoreductase [Frigidibacter sp. MR17.24]|uniref:SDR family NAD(P)-dependent oxidoreductase n=1 Tax=Frigidibacter sp. MR17.24 TaxID=3127345 RepID=UPI003012F393
MPASDPTADPAPARLALVTGASRGLGAAMAEALGARGWHVVAVARTTGALEELDDRIRAAGGAATLAPMDVTEAEAMTHLAASIAARWGGLGLWVHAAVHAAPLTPAGHVDGKDLAKGVAVNITATQHLISVLEPVLRAGGAVAGPVGGGTAIGFEDPVVGSRFSGGYGATKAGQQALWRAWAQECEKIGPRVLTATPAPMPTAIRARFHPGEDRAALTPCRDEAERILAGFGL